MSTNNPNLAVSIDSAPCVLCGLITKTNIPCPMKIICDLQAKNSPACTLLEYRKLYLCTKENCRNGCYMAADLLFDLQKHVNWVINDAITNCKLKAQDCTVDEIVDKKMFLN